MSTTQTTPSSAELLTRSQASDATANVATMQKTPRAKQISSLIEKYAGRIGQELPASVNAQKFVAGITTAIQKNPALLECSDQSLMSAVLMSAGFGLIPNTPLGHAWILPYNERQKDGTYKKAAQFQIGYQGLLALVRASGEVSQVQAQVVYKGDEFEYRYGLDQALNHTPCGNDKDEDITHAYAYVKLHDGTYTFEVMTIEQIKAIRKRSKSAEKGPWVTDFAMMCRKTVLTRICKLLPKGDLLARALESDHSEPYAQPQPDDERQLNEPILGETLIVSEQISEQITGATVETTDG